MRSVVRSYSSVFYSLVLAACMPLCAHAQSERSEMRRHSESTHSDWLKHEFSTDSARIYRYRPVHPLLGLDFRQTYLGIPHNDNIPINLAGIKAGIIIHDRHRTGLGFYLIRNPNLHSSTGDDIHLKFHSFTAFYEYYFIYTRHWSVGIPVEAGIGRYTAQGQDSVLNGKLTGITTAGIALDGHYKPVRWLSFNAMGGYRYASNNGPVNLNNWFYAVGVSVPLGYLVQDLQYRHRENKLCRELRYDARD